jgi:hypothetical protein
MEYAVGSRVRVKLYSGEEVEVKVMGIVNQTSGRRIQIQFGSVTILVSPQQIIEVLK